MTRKWDIGGGKIVTASEDQIHKPIYRLWKRGRVDLIAIGVLLIPAVLVVVAVEWIGEHIVMALMDAITRPVDQYRSVPEATPAPEGGDGK